ncbi:MAG: hypothetical protein K2P77_04465, partial [Burkholderiaceae bacterium]|nr:hypothetical protein [Burkholderiaceae bacterium]
SLYDLAALDPALRRALMKALLELNLGRVAQLLAPLPAPLVAAVEHMLRQHQYPQLCGLLDDAENGTASVS